MNAFANRLFLVFFVLVSVLSSCEMKKDILGQVDKPTDNKIKGDAGLLDLELKPQKEASIPDSKGGVSGSDVVVIDVNDFAIEILDSLGQVYKSYRSYADLKNEGGLLLPVGRYSVRATLGEDLDAAFDSPFYSGSNECEITPQEVAKVITDCVLSNKKIIFRCSDEFRSSFEDDYSIVVDNGNGALTTFRDETRAAYLRNTGVLQFCIYATTRSGKNDKVYNINLSGMQEVKDHNNILVDLGIVNDIPGGDDNPGGEDPDEPEDPGDDDKPEQPIKAPTIKVDVSLIEKDYVIEIPSNFVDAGGEEPENPSGDKDLPAITAEGFSFTKPVEISAGNSDVMVKINIKTPKKLASLEVAITSAVLEPLLEELGLGATFDMCNLSGEQASILTSLQLAIPEKGGIETLFDISAFMPMIALLDQPGNYLFKISVKDEAGNTASQTLTVTMK